MKYLFVELHLCFN